MSRWAIPPTKRNRTDGPIWGPPSYAFVSARAASVNYFLEEKRLELTVQITVMDPGGNRLKHSAAFPDPPTADGQPGPWRWNPIDACWEALTAPVRPVSLATAYWQPRPYYGESSRFKGKR